MIPILKKMLIISDLNLRSTYCVPIIEKNFILSITEYMYTWGYRAQTSGSIISIISVSDSVFVSDN